MTDKRTFPKLDFSKRVYEEELLDDLDLGGEELERNLSEIALINRLLGGNAVTVKGFERLWRSLGHDEQVLLRDRGVTIADLGCGGGELIDILGEWAKAKGIQKVRCYGFDANPHAVAFAKRQFPKWDFVTEDVLGEQYGERTFDFVTCTLFTHHFDEAQLAKMLATIRGQAAVGFVLNDLHRHFLAYHSISWLTAAFSRSVLTKHDARLSVRRGFDRGELLALLRGAGFGSCELTWEWAFRWLAVCSV